MKKISVHAHAPHMMCGGVLKLFRGARTAKVWIKTILARQPAGLSVCQFNGWRGGKPFKPKQFRGTPLF